MRFLLSLVLLFWPFVQQPVGSVGPFNSTPASTIALVSGHVCAGTSGGASTTTVTCTITGTQAAGNANLVFLFYCGNSSCSASPSGDTVTITDTHLNTYTVRTRNNGTNTQALAGIWTSCNIGTQASNAVLATTSNAGASYLRLLVVEVTGQNSTCYDGAGFVDFASNSTSPVSVATGVGTATNELVIGGFNSNVAFSASSGTLLTSSDASSALYTSQTQATTAAATAAATFSGTGTNMQVLAGRFK